MAVFELKLENNQKRKNKLMKTSTRVTERETD